MIIRKGVPWDPNAVENVVTASNNSGCGPKHGDAIPAISSDGKSVAFARCNGNPTGGWSLWKAPLAGGTAIQLTPTDASTNFYPSWSPDGNTIYFQRLDPTLGPQWRLLKVSTITGSIQVVFAPPVSPPDTFDIVQPATSPDGKVLVAGYGRRDTQVPTMVTHTLDPALSSPAPDKLITNFSETRFAVMSSFADFPILSPRVSPDGTRLALGSKQMWAARRNMNLPPRITQVGSTAVGDTTASVTFAIVAGSSTSLAASSSDPEGDPITCAAHFLKSWMTFDLSTCTLFLNPPGGVGGSFHVVLQVTTPSDGTDAIVAIINVSLALRGGSSEGAPGGLSEANGPNPTRGAFTVHTSEVQGAAATLTVFDLAGRRVTTVRGRSGDPITWDGRNGRGLAVEPGIYLYRIEVGRQRQEGRIVVVR